MKRLKSTRKVLRHNLPTLALIGILALSLTSCDSIFGTDEEARITVTNQYGESLDIYFDESLQFTLEHEGESTIEDVSTGEHSLEARIADTEDVVSSTTINVEDKENYTWTIE